jgi:hypothetical protein
MEREGSFPWAQQPASCPYPEFTQSHHGRLSLSRVHTVPPRPAVPIPSSHSPTTASCPYPEFTQSHHGRLSLCRVNTVPPRPAVPIPSSHSPTTASSSYWSLPSGFPTKILYAYLISPMHATFPAHLVFLDLVILIVLCKEYKLWNPHYMQCFSNLLSLHLSQAHRSETPSCNVRHPYKTTAIIIVLYILIFKSLYCRRKRKYSELHGSWNCPNLICS